MRGKGIAESSYVLKHIDKYMYSVNRGKVIFTNTPFLAEKFSTEQEALDKRVSEEWKVERYG